MRRFFLIFTVIISFNSYICPAHYQEDHFFREVILKIGTSEYTMSRNSYYVGREKQLTFEYKNEDEVCEVNIFAEPDTNLKELRMNFFCIIHC